ncbi:MAG: HEAT repeat domain-containing protein [Planctomycetes bacterium]|nr:HEAT repeat domain-containing protein [Planctomycetota bacterium]
MADSRKLRRFAVGVLAVALLAAAQPPGSTPPPAPPLTLPTIPGGQPVAPPALPSPRDFAPPTLQPALPPHPSVPPGRRFDFKIDPKATAKDLLPPAPKVNPVRGPVADDLKAVPEVEFAARPEKSETHDKLANDAAHQIAKINHANAKKTDAFMSALLESRPDLAGMPFAMGDDCRTSGERLKYLTHSMQLVRQALGATQVFWQRYTTLCEQVDGGSARLDKAAIEHMTVSRIAALMQMLAPESAEIRMGLVKYLAGVPHVEATKALARLAIYSAEADVREAALTALKVRRERDYTHMLVKGLRYPWPTVAKRSAEAIAKLERTDLVPELLNVLDAADPRMPVVKEEDGEKVTTVRELVKVNHHRNCLMCHAPSGSGTPNPNAITAEVAVQGQPLPSPSEGGYRQSTPELMIRLDVTYLRQDFSAVLSVADAHPWPEMQRFDFFVRERKLTAGEAAEYREKLTPKEEGVLSPYHKAALAALREMTGKDAAPTVAAWRKLLNVPR